MRNRFGSAALLLEERRSDLRVDEAVVIDIEAAAQTESRSERKCADECAGAIAVRFEHSRERLDRRRKSKAGIIPDAVIGWVFARQNVRMRGQGRDVVRVRVG